jgi:RNA polymerase sigma factor (TIGR02999 family)
MSSSVQQQSTEQKALRHDRHPCDQHFERDYRELRRIAQSRLHRNGGSQTLDAATLVNECYLKLRTSKSTIVGERTAFLAYASRTMQSVIIDRIREDQSQRRGGNYQTYSMDSLDESELMAANDDVSERAASDIRRAIDQLARSRPRLAQVVTLRFLHETSMDEIAQSFDLDKRTIRRDCTAASALLCELLA